jgi:chromosome segregation ATPase
LAQKTILQASLTEATQRLENLTKQNQQLETERNSLQKGVQNLELTSQKLCFDLSRSQEQLTKAYEDNRKIEAALSKLQVDYDNATARISEYAADLTLLRTDLDTSEEKCHELEQEVLKANDIISRLQSDMKTYKFKYKKAAADSERLASESNFLKDQNSAQIKDQEALKERLTALEKELASERATKTKLEADLKLAQDTIEKHVSSKHLII